ncbi:MAG: methylmalonyl-CoA epimerase [Deltaproteobacteria bacterium]|nr:methylmalonyl-CoA epimerase [Deltaproteobacteria bacterium]
MAVEKLNHVAIAVNDIAEAKRLFEDILGLAASEPEIVETQKVKTVMIKLGDTRIELLEPTSGDSAIAKFLEKKGPGLHHLCYQVDDIEATIDAMKNSGRKMIDETARPGAHGTMIAFAHPKSTGGVLTEFAEVKK